jgi:hypothetical protein
LKELEKQQDKIFTFEKEEESSVFQNQNEVLANFFQNLLSKKDRNQNQVSSNSGSKPENEAKAEEIQNQLQARIVETKFTT